MINVRNVQGQNAFLQGLFWKSFDNFFSLKFFHYNNCVCPINLFSADWFVIVKTCGFGFKFVFENFLRSFASVLVLVANKKCSHKFLFNFFHHLNVSVMHTLCSISFGYISFLWRSHKIFENSFSFNSVNSKIVEEN